MSAEFSLSFVFLKKLVSNSGNMVSPFESIVPEEKILSGSTLKLYTEASNLMSIASSTEIILEVSSTGSSPTNLFISTISPSGITRKMYITLSIAEALVFIGMAKKSVIEHIVTISVFFNLSNILLFFILSSANTLFYNLLVNFTMFFLFCQHNSMVVSLYLPYFFAITLFKFVSINSNSLAVGLILIIAESCPTFNNPCPT